MDQNKPARFLDTAYNALKANPGATNQILQAAAQGQPVGLRGLAAAAAQQSQQEAQKAMTALQQQGPQPNIVQKLATQGIMSQMDTGLPMAPQMGAPEEMPQQMMAGGGLVSFADGGNVLPPDVIEAIQSHFAEGGEVRGFTEGKNVDLDWRMLDPTLSDESFIHALERNKQAAREEALLSGDMAFTRSPYKEEEWARAEAKAPTGVRQGSPYEKANAAFLELFGNPTPEQYGQSYLSPSMWAKGAEPAGLGLGAISAELPKEAPKETTKETKTPATPATWKPESHDRTEVKPSPRLSDEAAKVYKPFDEAKTDVPSAAVTPDSEAQGLGGLDQGKEMVDYIKSLYGEKKMDPEIAKKLADLEDKARTSTILQSVLGGLAGGLSNPYGGRFALGSAALQALGGYQKGIGSEEDIQRKALDIERAYADQPADLQRTAAKEYFDLAKEKAKMLSAERVAGERSESALDRLLRSEEGKLLRSQIMSGQKGDVTEGQKLTAWNQAREQAAKEIKDEYIGATPPEGELERRTQKHYLAALNSIITATGGGLGAGQAQQQQSGLGGGATPTGRSIIGGKLTGSSPQ